MVAKNGNANNRMKPFDPTENVKELNKASNRRQDDLRKANNKLFRSEIRRLGAQIKCLEELGNEREKHAQQMRISEAGRLDSIRQVDVTAVKTEADRAQTAITALAKTTDTNAENLRNNLQATATTIAKSTSDTVGEITSRLAALEKSSYEGKGKEAVADPMMTEFIQEMRLLSKTSAVGAGKSAGVASVGTIIVGCIAALASLAAIFFGLIATGVSLFLIFKPH